MKWGYRLPDDATPECEREARKMLLRDGERYRPPTMLGRDKGAPKAAKFAPDMGKIKNTYKYLGIYRIASSGRWVAVVWHEGRRNRLGSFPTEESAARAYDAAARRIKGPGARLNFPDEG